MQLITKTDVETREQPKNPTASGRRSKVSLRKPGDIGGKMVAPNHVDPARTGEPHPAPASGRRRWNR